LARTTAYRAFGLPALTAALLVVVFFSGGRLRGWGGYGHYAWMTTVWWYVPLRLLRMFTAQVALAAGVLALLRAWRLRRVPVMTAADAAILNRRAAIGLTAGAITMVVMPLTNFAIYLGEGWGWHNAAKYLGCAAILVLLATLPDVLRAARLRPSREGAAGDLGTQETRATPWSTAIALSVAIVIVLTLIGVRSATPIDGLIRGLLDASACMIGFTALGGYLGLRTTS
jgi:hypothetical protein